jgi:hypothetical protein
MLDHLCDLDELRKTNIQKHEGMRGGDKFDVACATMARRRHNFPAVLLVLREGASAVRAEQAAAGVRSQYSNSHIFLASEPLIPSPLSMKRAPMPDSNREYQRYDVVIEVRPGGHALVSPPGKNNLPFARSLVP